MLLGESWSSNARVSYKVAVHSANVFKRRLDGLLQGTTAALGDCLVYYELRGNSQGTLDLRDCA